MKHSPPQRGGVDATSREFREASFVGADGVVNRAICFRTRPPRLRLLRRLREILLIAQPPLLKEEGSCSPPKSPLKIAPQNRPVNRLPQSLSITLQSLSIALNRSQSLSITLNHSQSLSITLNRSQSLSIALNHSQSLSITLNRSESLSIALNHSQSLSIALNHSQSLSIALNRSESLSISLLISPKSP